MNCCYPRLHIEVDITEITIPEDENLVREQHDMLEEDERMLSIRRHERRIEEYTRRSQEDNRREREEQQREKEKSRILLEKMEYKRYQLYQDVKSIYYIHPLTIDRQLSQRMKEQDRWKEEDLRRRQEDLRRTQEDERRKQEDKQNKIDDKLRKQRTRRILVKAKHYNPNVEPKYTFQELVQQLKTLEKLEPG